MSNKVIFKYPLYVTDVQVVNLPKGSRILHVDTQSNGGLFLWVEHDSGIPGVTQRSFDARHIAIRGTGHPFGPIEGESFVGTVVVKESQLVWHVYELPAPTNDDER